MKAATCALAVSVLTATTAALATTTTSAADGVFSEGNPSNLKGKDCVISSLEKEKFAPRFDGLRFIETLVKLFDIAIGRHAWLVVELSTSSEGCERMRSSQLKGERNGEWLNREGGNARQS